MKKIAIITCCVTIILMSFACRKGSVAGAGIIRSVTPDSGHFGTVVTIRGEGFDSINGYVTIDGVMMPITQISDTAITLTVSTAHTGPVVVKSTTGGSTTGPTFQYLDDILVAGWLVLNPGNPDVGVMPFTYPVHLPLILAMVPVSGPGAHRTPVTPSEARR